MESINSAEYMIPFLSFVFGIFGTIFTTQILRRRGLVTYQVVHNQVGLTTDDSHFGNVKITWNDKELSSLWISTVEIKNVSSDDFQNLILKVHSEEDTKILTEKTSINSTEESIDYTKDFQAKHELSLDRNKQTNENIMFNRQRDYKLSVFNRDDILRLVYLTNVQDKDTPNKMPYLSVQIHHKGLKVKQIFHPELIREIFSVPIAQAGLVGIPVSIVLVFASMSLITSTTWVIWIALIIGLSASIPGAIGMKAIKWIKALLKG